MAPLIRINGVASSLADLAKFASEAAKQLGPSWKCICGKWNRGKDLSCWTGCKRSRAEGEVSSK